MSFNPRLSLLALSLCSALYAHADEFEGDHVVVTGSRIEQKLEDVAGSVTVITDEDIERRLVTDIESLFRYDPSITTTGTGAQPQTITVRGIGGNRLVYIKDGRRVNDAYAGGGGFLVGRGYFDTDQVRQIEVAKGAASSLYGSDGLGGIVVVSTKDPEDYLKGETYHVALGFGYEGASNQQRYALTGAAKIDDWAFSAAYTRRDGHEVQNYAGDLPGYDARSDAILLKAVYSLDDNRTVKFTAELFEQDLTQVIDEGVNETRVGDEQTAFSLDYISDVSGAFWDSWSGQIYHSQYKQGTDQVAFSTRGYTDFNDYRFEQDILGLRLQFAKTLQTEGFTHQLVYGWDYDDYDTGRPRLKTRVAADGTVTFTDQPQRTFPGADTLLTGLFIQDNIDMQDSDWSFVLGLRADYYTLEAKNDPLYADAQLDDIDETALSPKVAALYDVTENITVYGQYVRGFKIPPHDQAYQSHGVEPFYQILPNAELDPEKSDVYETGIRYNDDTWNVQFNGFYSEFENFIETAVVGVEPTFIPGVMKTLFQYQNLESATIHGVEFAASYWALDNLNLQLNLAYTKGENDETDQPLNTVSPLQGSAILEWDLDEWQLSAALRFARAMTDVPTDAEGNNLAETPGYGLVDVFAQYQGDGWRLNFGVDNLFDKEYVPYEAIAGQVADIPLNQFTQPGRNLSASVEFRF